jgi:trimeric autotransporter adhesin
MSDINPGSRNGTTGSDFVVAKFNSDGTDDTSFGVNGITTTDMGTAYDYSKAIAIQADGKVIIAGNVFNSTSSYDFAIARYNNDGSLDTSFGNAGKVITLGTSADYAEAIAIQVDGKIIVSGTASDSQGINFASIRYNSDGSLDTTFGHQGKVRTSVNSSSYGYATAIQTDGKIVVSGDAYSILLEAVDKFDQTLIFSTLAN